MIFARYRCSIVKLCCSILFISVLTGCTADRDSSATEPAFNVADQTLKDIVDALETGDITSTDLVEAYLARIDTMDWQGPTLNAVIATHPNAMALAAESDEGCRATEPAGWRAGVVERQYRV